MREDNSDNLTFFEIKNEKKFIISSALSEIHAAPTIKSFFKIIFK